MGVCDVSVCVKTIVVSVVFLHFNMHQILAKYRTAAKIIIIRHDCYISMNDMLSKQKEIKTSNCVWRGFKRRKVTVAAACIEMKSNGSQNE